MKDAKERNENTLSVGEEKVQKVTYGSQIMNSRTSRLSTSGFPEDQTRHQVKIQEKL